ncbi:hypothetical protein ACMFMF_000457 [Clarireedia jacksonii]
MSLRVQQFNSSPSIAINLQSQSFLSVNITFIYLLHPPLPRELSSPAILHTSITVLLRSKSIFKSEKRRRHTKPPKCANTTTAITAAESTLAPLEKLRALLAEQDNVLVLRMSEKIPRSHADLAVDSNEQTTSHL